MILVKVACLNVLWHYAGGEDGRFWFILHPIHISITEMEYNHAVQRGIPVMIFLMDKEHPIKIEDIEGEIMRIEKSTLIIANEEGEFIVPMQKLSNHSIRIRRQTADL